jgi:hypothetical protein
MVYIPLEVIDNIASYMPVEDVCRLRLASKGFAETGQRYLVNIPFLSPRKRQITDPITI